MLDPQDLTQKLVVILRTYAGTLDIVVEELKLPKEEDKQLW
jgi:hypothetical protein